MSLIDLKPSAVPIELRVKIERVMKSENLTWREALLFLAREVVSPSRLIRRTSKVFCH